MSAITLPVNTVAFSAPRSAEAAEEKDAWDSARLSATSSLFF
jgi:hypothetical protein